MSEQRLSELVQHLRDGRLNRRQLVRGAAALGLSTAATATVARGTAGAAPGTGTRFTSRRSQIDASTLVIADHVAGEQWLYMDPGRFYEINSAAALNMIYETLYHAPNSTQPDVFEPLLAADLPEISADGTQVTIPLRSGVTFHNTGNEMTANDWLFSWNRLKFVNGNGAFLATAYWNAVEAVDPMTLRLTFERGVAPLLAILSSLPLAVTEGATMRENGGSDVEGADQTDTATDWINAGNSAGTGPFRLTAWDKTGEVVLERHEGYWGEAPALERIIWRNVESATEQVQVVQAGEADIAYSADPDVISELEGDEELQIITGPTLAIEYLAMHTQEDPGGPLATKDLRQAIGYAVDYQGIINDLMGGAAENPGPATIVPLPLLSAAEAQEFAYTTDLARAQELFNATGLGEVELTFSYGSGDTGVGGLSLETLATKLQSDLQQIDGLTITLNPMDPETRLTEYRAGNLQFTVSPWTPDFPDVDSYAVPFAHSGDTGTAARRVGYGTPEIDEKLDAGLYELDEEARKQLYLDVQRQLIEDAPFLVLYQPLDRKPARANVQGVATHSIYQLQLRGASKSE